MIFGINTTSDISKLLYVISRAVRQVKFATILKETDVNLFLECQNTFGVQILHFQFNNRKRRNLTVISMCNQMVTSEIRE